MNQQQRGIVPLHTFYFEWGVRQNGFPTWKMGDKVRRVRMRASLIPGRAPALMGPRALAPLSVATALPPLLIAPTLAHTRSPGVGYWGGLLGWATGVGYWGGLQS